MKWINKKYEKFFYENGYVPKMFNPYNGIEIMAIAPTVTTNCGKSTSSATILIKENKSPNNLIKFDIPSQVKVRKNEVDISSLKQVLKEHKKKNNLTIIQISKKLNQPKTLVEHWFRNDDSFSIPDANIWFELKKLIGIITTEFDESVTTFEIKDGIYEKSNRVYSENGVSPTLTCASSESEKILTKGEYKMNNYEKDLIKYDFKMEELRLFDSFAGIGHYIKL